MEVAKGRICEVLSPSTMYLDKTKKMPIYAKHNVKHIWLINPIEKTLDAFKLVSGGWFLLNAFVENDKARAEPFREFEIDLAEL